MTSQDGDRVIFERFETPRPAPKGTLKKNWQSQEEQHSTSNTDVPSLWKQGTKGEDQAGAQDSRSGPRHKETGAYHLEHGCGTHLGIKEVSTDALLKSEAVKEEIAETNTKAIERIKSGSNKICVREDLAKEKMMFSQESSQAIFEMGNVELLELKTSRIQCPSCLHYDFKGTIICARGKHIRPDQEMIRQILKAPYFRTSVVTSRGYKHGPD